MSKSKIDKINTILKDLGESNHIIVEPIPGYANHRIGIEPKSKYIIVLIESINPEGVIYAQGGGKYLSISYDVSCTIKSKEGGVEKDKIFTVILLKTKEKDIESYFIELCLVFLNRIGNRPKITDVKIQFDKLSSIFEKLSRVSTKSVIGLWGELFLISKSANPTYLINAWHSDSFDKFDFNDGKDRIEVKTTNGNYRKHHFEIKQLKKFPDSLTIIASILTSKIDLGSSVLDLTKRIKKRVATNEYENLISKIFEIIGNKINEISDEKFDYNMAASELQFYFSENIPKPELIPVGVSDVKFISDLEIESVKHIPKSKFKGVLLNNFK